MKTYFIESAKKISTSTPKTDIKKIEKLINISGYFIYKITTTWYKNELLFSKIQQERFNSNLDESLQYSYHISHSQLRENFKGNSISNGLVDSQLNIKFQSVIDDFKEYKKHGTLEWVKSTIEKLNNILDSLSSLVPEVKVLQEFLEFFNQLTNYKK